MNARTSTHVELRPGAYADSVTLLQVSRAVQGVDGVAAAQVAMATAAQRRGAGARWGSTLPAATANDMVVAIRLDDADALDAALAAVDTRTDAYDEPRRRRGRPGRPTAPPAPRSARPAPTRSCWSRCPAPARPSRRWTLSTPATT